MVTLYLAVWPPDNETHDTLSVRQQHWRSAIALLQHVSDRSLRRHGEPIIAIASDRRRHRSKCTGQNDYPAMFQPASGSVGIAKLTAAGRWTRAGRTAALN